MGERSFLSFSACFRPEKSWASVREMAEGDCGEGCACPWGLENVTFPPGEACALGPRAGATGRLLRDQWRPASSS